MLLECSNANRSHHGSHRQQQDVCDPLGRIDRADNPFRGAGRRLVYPTVRAPLSALLLATAAFVRDKVATSRPALHFYAYWAFCGGSSPASPR